MHEVGDGDLIFRNDDGKPWDANALVKRQFKPALERAGVKRVRFHDLRHSYVSLQIEIDQNIVYISKQIGHENPDTTLKVYSHLMKEANPEAALKLDRTLGFTELPDGSSEGVRYLLGKTQKGATAETVTPW